MNFWVSKFRKLSTFYFQSHVERLYFFITKLKDAFFSNKGTMMQEHPIVSSSRNMQTRINQGHVSMRKSKPGLNRIRAHAKIQKLQFWYTLKGTESSFQCFKWCLNQRILERERYGQWNDRCPGLKSRTCSVV